MDTSHSLSHFRLFTLHFFSFVVYLNSLNPPFIRLPCQSLLLTGDFFLLECDDASSLSFAAEPLSLSPQARGDGDRGTLVPFLLSYACIEPYNAAKLSLGTTIDRETKSDASGFFRKC